MNWILQESNKFYFHTDISALLHPLEKHIDYYNWLLCDLDFLTDKLEELPINLDDAYFILSPADFKKLIATNIQIVWGVILAIPKDKLVEVDKNHLPFANGNDAIWKPGNMQLDAAQIEIDCFDSTCTIVKFKAEELSNQFIEYFTEAIPLNKVHL